MVDCDGVLSRGMEMLNLIFAISPTVSRDLAAIACEGHGPFPQNPSTPCTGLCKNWTSRLLEVFDLECLEVCRRYVLMPQLRFAHYRRDVCF